MKVRQKRGHRRVRRKRRNARAFFVEPEECPRFTQMEGLETTILTGLRGEKMMMALNATLRGYSVPMHCHPHEQVGVVYAGKAKLRIGGEERLVRRGDIYCIPSNVPHGDTTVGDQPFVMLDIFYPIRKDFVKKSRYGKIGPKHLATDR